MQMIRDGVKEDAGKIARLKIDKWLFKKRAHKPNLEQTKFCSNRAHTKLQF